MRPEFFILTCFSGRHLELSGLELHYYGLWPSGAASFADVYYLNIVSITYHTVLIWKYTINHNNVDHCRVAMTR